ncbi:MAG: cryptochrome/photolyase family protein [Verrucomicrobia bacterium]|nr:cryptochrome/photolyase family protein [Verrucomicrobiota bacterium]
MQQATILLPHQLYKNSPLLQKDRLVIFVEDPLFFRDKHYPALFHKQKLLLHRASMKAFEAELQSQGYTTLYKDAGSFSYSTLFSDLKLKKLYAMNPVDYIATLRIEKACKKSAVQLEWHKSCGFLTDIPRGFHQQAHFNFTPFYVAVRKELDILLDSDNKPVGGKWTYDIENRKKAPKTLAIPSLPRPSSSCYLQEAKEYVQKRFGHNIGKLEPFIYPVTHTEAKKWLTAFIKERLYLFGTYQDAIMQNELSMMHALISPLLNIGLLTPEEVVEETLQYAKKHEIPLNSLEGFIRQVIGWREFVKTVYEVSHVKQRTRNFWNHTRKIPASFYSGTTGIPPIDITIKKCLNFAYCHHIERLMVLGNFMLLCEFDPDEIYRWFMEMFIDSYDWVMVPNVYGMSQYADGGLMTTKPYISGSNYILKMSDYSPGPWCEIWDGLFWRFIAKHKQFFVKQPRLSMIVGQLDKVDPKKLEAANSFLASLDS